VGTGPDLDPDAKPDPAGRRVVSFVVHVLPPVLFAEPLQCTGRAGGSDVGLQRKDPAGRVCLGLLAVAFIVLKLTGVINWSWLWVLAPIWIPTAITLAIIVIVLVAVLVRELTKGGRP